MINTILCFPLAVMVGVQNMAAIHHASQSALLPALYWLHLRDCERTQMFTADGLITAALIVIYCLIYPLNSLLGIAVLFTFAFCLIVTREFRVDSQSRL